MQEVRKQKHPKKSVRFMHPRRQQRLAGTFRNAAGLPVRFGIFLSLMPETRAVSHHNPGKRSRDYLTSYTVSFSLSRPYL